MPGLTSHCAARTFFSLGIFLFLSASRGISASPDLSKLPPPAASKIDFVKDIQPILSQSCFDCHGPKRQEADLRWDSKDIAIKEGSANGPVIIPGKSAESKMIQLVAGLDPENVMPKKGDRLTAEQIGLLRAWIDQGANWPDSASVKAISRRDHWSFKAPVRPTVPKVKNKKWVRNPIDNFVLAKLEKEKLSPSPEADRVTLIRRLSLDLIGLPPTLKEIDDFVSDKSPDAYQKVVERLLASPHYGERWGRHWLDAARYADSNGFEKDLTRSIWPYRDWVINAYNRDLPFNEFAIEQLAGDLLPNATTEQKVATGFLRNSMLNEEGGIDPEEFRIVSIIDREDTIGKTFLGLTINCAQCHNHKYDPISQKEYYRIFAFLNNDDEPSLEVPNAGEKKKRAEILKTVAKIEDELRAKPEATAQMADWEKEMGKISNDWTVLDPEKFYGGVGTKFAKLDDSSLLATGSSPPISTYTVTVKTKLKGITGFRLEALTDPNLPAYGPGRADNGNFVLTEFSVEAAPENEPEKTNEVELANATADFSQNGFPVQAAIDGDGVKGPKKKSYKGDGKNGWANDGGPQRRNQESKAVFQTAEPIGFDDGTILKFTMVQSFGKQHTIGRFRISATTAKDPVADPLSKKMREVIAIAPEKRTKEQKRELFSAFRFGNTNFPDANKKIEEAMAKWPDAPTTLVLLQRTTDQRETHIFKRGDWSKPGDLVTPGVPAVLHPIDTNQPMNRLAFAKWIADERNPVTPRVIVNRIWGHYFGRGIVSTVEDFGTQGDPPTHPKLLDWLATEFIRQNWSMKQMHRLIVNSATYRQSSVVSPALYERDQYNELLARGPRFRVEAEIIRDIALSAGGLLTTNIGGPSVYPPIPDGVLNLGYGSPMKWPTETGPNRYRRAMYTFWKRSVPYPSLSVFDQPNADFSCPRRLRSNTPLQALTTLNDPLFQEAAQSMALRVWKNGGTTDKERIDYAFRLCVGREPNSREVKHALALLNDQENYFENRTTDAIKVAAIDEKNPPDNVNLHKVAAWAMVSRVLLNLDETITKE
jgi:mono/diheme cytochrome c family protein